MVEFGTSSAFRGWVRVLGYGFGVRGRKVKSRDCALASDLVTKTKSLNHCSHYDIFIVPRSINQNGQNHKLCVSNFSLNSVCA